MSFRQVYLNRDRRGDALRSDAGKLLLKLRSAGGAADASQEGDASLLEHAFKDASGDTVQKTFGQAFADRLNGLPLGEWSGPVESAFGLHLVLVDARVEGRAPALAEVRDAVARD